MNDELDALLPETQKVAICGREIEVGPMTVDQILRVLKVFNGGKLDKMTADTSLVDLIEAFPDEMIAVAMIVTGLAREEIGQARTDEFVELLAAIIERNRDFFVRRLGPSLRHLLGELVSVAAMGEAGFARSRS